MSTTKNQPQADYLVLMTMKVLVSGEFDQSIFENQAIVYSLLKTINMVGVKQRTVNSRRVQEFLYDISYINRIENFEYKVFSTGECTIEQSWYTTNLQKRRYLDKDDWTDYERLPNYYELKRETEKCVSECNGSSIHVDGKSVLMSWEVIDNIVTRLARFNDYNTHSNDEIRNILIQNLESIDLDNLGSVGLYCTHATYIREMEIPLVIKDKEHSASFSTFKPDKFEPDIYKANARIAILERHLSNIYTILEGNYNKTNIKQHKELLACEFYKLDEYKDKYNWIATDIGYV